MCVLTDLSTVRPDLPYNDRWERNKVVAQDLSDSTHTGTRTTTLDLVDNLCTLSYAYIYRNGSHLATLMGVLP